MAEDRPATPPPAAPWQAAARTAVVALLLVITVTGLRARALLHAGRASFAQASGQVLVTVFLVAEALAAVCLVAVFVLAGRRPRRRRPADEEHVYEAARPSRLARLIARRVRDGRLRTNIGNVASLDDAVAALNPTERISGRTILRVRP